MIGWFTRRQQGQPRRLDGEQRPLEMRDGGRGTICVDQRGLFDVAERTDTARGLSSEQSIQALYRLHLMSMKMLSDASHKGPERPDYSDSIEK
jgi:hypothetical protein